MQKKRTIDARERSQVHSSIDDKRLMLWRVRTVVVCVVCGEWRLARGGKIGNARKEAKNCGSAAAAFDRRAELLRTAGLSVYKCLARTMK